RRFRHCGGVQGASAGRAARGGRECRALDADVEVDDPVVVDVDLAVVVEIAVGPTGDAERHGEVDAAVVVDVDLAVEIRVPAVGVHHQRVAAGNRLSRPDGGIGGSGQAFDFLAGGHADAVEVAAGGDG